MLKITGGLLRGRRIAAPKGKYTRPTLEKVREGIFNTVSNLVELEGSHVIDLFSGSGALGIEALSRGAAQVTFVESHPKTAALIRTNLAGLEPLDGAWRVVVSTVAAWMKKLLIKSPQGSPPGLIFLDPPYSSTLALETLSALAASPLAPPGALIVLESIAGKSAAGKNTSRKIPFQPGESPQDLSTITGLELIQGKRYGDTQVFYYFKNG